MELVFAALITGAFGVLGLLIERTRREAKSELKPNGGSSMRDEVRLVLKHVLTLDDKVNQVVREQANVRAELAEFRDKIK